MPELRVKGEEISVLLVVNGQTQNTVTDFRNFDGAIMLDTLQEGYLGETSDRFDDVVRGVRAKMDLHFENPDVFTLMQTIVDRSQRRTPGTKVNVKLSMSFPSGRRVRALIPDVFFGEIPLGFAGRTEYGQVTFDMKASGITFLTT